MTTTQAQGPAVHVQGLEKAYKELHVLQGVDFDVARGSIFALLGSNGAGKTTVMRILSTLLKADAGTAIVNGFDVASQAADVRESFSLTGQFAAVDEILTAGRTSCWSPGCGTSRTRARSRMTCSSASADRCGRAEGVDVFGWHAPPSRHRDEPHRKSAGHLP